MIEYDDIRDSIRLDEVLSELGLDTEIVRSEHWCSCPLPTHPGADLKASFSVNEDSLLYNCFSCGGGPLPHLIRILEGFPAGKEGWEEALEWLLPYSDGDVETDEGYMKQLLGYLERAESRPKRTRRVALPFYPPRVIDRLTDAPVALLEKWNIHDQETVAEHQIKYVEARRRVSKKGEYVGPALIIPHYFEGKLVGYQERWLDEGRGNYPPKYTNSDDFPKAQTLYGWDSALEEARRGTPVSVVESTMTRARLWELGYPAVATFGASVSDEQLRLLRALPGGVILASDDDPDYWNAEGKLVRGAGKAALDKNIDNLTDFIPVEVLPPIGIAKADLADLPEEEVHSLYDRRKPVFVPKRHLKERTRG